jgi:hypothetical protein
VPLTARSTKSFWPVCPPTLEPGPYLARRATEGKTTREITGCLKRAVAREVYKHLVNPQPVPVISDLRPLRHARHVTLEHAAHHLNCWATELSRLERGIKRNDLLAERYRDWLTSLPNTV